MDAGLIARRYATVLHDYAKDRGKLEEVYADAVAICQALASQPQAEEYLGSPLHKPSEKRALVQEVFGSHVTEETLQFMTFLVEKDRIGMAGAILRVFGTLYKEENDICTATITTAKELTDEQRSRIVEQIASKLRASGKRVTTVDAEFKVKPAIIGGMILTIDGRQLDNSVESKLRKLEKTLTV